MRFAKVIGVFVVVGCLSGVSLAGSAGDAKAGGATTRPYPSEVCVVSGEKLGGEMGEPAVIEYEGREVQFCCKSCVKQFKADPAKYLKKLDAAAAGPTTRP